MRGRGGVYKSTDSGLTWLPKNSSFPTDSGGKPAVVMSIAVDPNNPAIVWAGTEREGVVKSIDGGDAWQVKGFVDVPDVDAVAVKPGNSNVILVGTGDYRSGGRSGEIQKSTDGGQTWQLKYRGKSTITDFVYDPRNPNWVYAGTGYLPNYGGEGGEGVLRSLDGGEHWASYSSDLFNPVVFSLAISAEDAAPAARRHDGVGIVRHAAPAFEAGLPAADYAVVGGSFLTAGWRGRGSECQNRWPEGTSSSNSAQLTFVRPAILMSDSANAFRNPGLVGESRKSERFHGYPRRLARLANVNCAVSNGLLPPATAICELRDTSGKRKLKRPTRAAQCVSKRKPHRFRSQRSRRAHATFRVLRRRGSTSRIVNCRRHPCPSVQVYEQLFWGSPAAPSTADPNPRLQAYIAAARAGQRCASCSMPSSTTRTSPARAATCARWSI